MSVAIQPPLKLSILFLTPKEGTCSRGLFNSFWERGKGARAYSCYSWSWEEEESPSLSLSLLIFIPPLK
jgi:hypothetical protein